MPFVGNQPAQSYSSFAKQDFTTSATTSYTLDYPVANENEIALFINFVRQEPTTAYTANGTSLTLTSATSASDDMYAVFIGKAVQTITPLDGSITSAKISYPLTNFTSTGIDDNATNTAITIDGNETSTLQCSAGDSNFALLAYHPTSTGTRTIAKFQSNVGGTQEDKVVIQTSGNVGINTSSPSPDYGSDTVLEVSGSTSPGIVINDTGQASKYGIHADSNDLKITYGSSALTTFQNDGKVGIGTTSPGFHFTAISEVNGNYTARIQNNDTQYPYALNLKFDASPDNSTNSAFMVCSDGTGNRMIVWSDGDLDNHDNSYGAISDERIKQDIRDANSQWNDIKNIRVRNFKKKDDIRQYGENAKEQIGVISQELEQVSPKLVKLTNPTSADILSDASFGTLYQEGDEIPEGKEIGDVKEIFEQVKRVNYSVLYMKAVKALQETMERIETLEAKVTVLENK